MKTLLSILTSFFLFSSCIPLRIAPNIKEDKIKIAKRFKRYLPKQYALIFKDPKDADEFYHFINTKYNLEYKSVEDNVPFKINDDEFSFSFYEVERITKTINVVPIFIDIALGTEDDPILEDSYSSRKEHWYITLLATDNEMHDCLAPEYKNREKVIKYLRDLRKEYVNTNNYLEAMVKQKMIEEKMNVN